MRRRTLLATLSLAGLPRAAFAQPARVFRVGWVVSGSSAAAAPYLEALRAGLAERGYVEGRNLVLTTRFGDDQPERVPGLIAELLAMPVDVVATQGPSTWVVTGTVKTVPVVYVFSADPVIAGMAQSFARPGGNSTGVTLMAVEMNGKRLQLLREILPGLRRATIIASPDHRGEDLELANSQEMAKRLGIDIRHYPVHSTGEVEAALAAIAGEGTEAVIAFPDPVTMGNRKRIIDFAASRRVPVISGWAQFADSGALLSYGPRLSESYRRAAYYVDRILNGAKPGDLPVERPTVFELVLNLQTARNLGITLPPSVLARSDRVIE